MTRLGHCPEAYAARVAAEVERRLVERDWPAVQLRASELSKMSPDEWVATVAAAFGVRRPVGRSER